MEQAYVFKELTDDGPMPGYGELIIRATIKTVKGGFHPFAFKTPLAGKPAYPFVFNIGGQGVNLVGQGNPGYSKEVCGWEKKS
jgi:hypothetical protein